MKINSQEPYGRAAARVGLFGGLLVTAVVLGQQWTASNDLFWLGTFGVPVALVVIGQYAAREAAASSRPVGQRAGLLAGLLASLIAALSLAGMFTFVSLGVITPPSVTAHAEEVTPNMVEQSLNATYGEENARNILAMSQYSTEDIAALVPRVSVAITMACCGLGLPLLGAFLGSLGGALATRPDRPAAPPAE